MKRHLIYILAVSLTAYGVEYNEKAYDEFKIFAYEWLEYASNNLEWSELQIAAIAASRKDLKIIN